ncbi:uncharacterized protein LOC144144958 [Haemaphysalis longicornis]
MYFLSLSSVALLSLAAYASGYICSDFIGSPCSAAMVFGNFWRAHLVATTTKYPDEILPAVFTRLSPVWGTVDFHFRSHRHKGRSTARLFGHSDQFLYLMEHEPHTLHPVRIPFADYRHCFVVNFAHPDYGCALWVQEHASPRVVNRCLQAIRNVCRGPLHTIWDRPSVRGSGHTKNQW